MLNTPSSGTLCCALSIGLALFSSIAHSQECPPPITVTTYVYDCSYCTNLGNDLSANNAMDTILATDPTIAMAAYSPSAV